MCADETDPVVKEIPVYLAKSLSDELFLLQHLVRPANKSYDFSSFLSSRVKIKQQKIEIELPISTRSDHYDKSKGEQFALQVDGKLPDESEALFNSELMDKQLLTSTRSLKNSENYAIGAIKNGELHLTPMTGVLQMRPSFTYLDKSDARIPKTSNDLGEASQDEEEPEATTVTVKFARRETERIKQARENSYAYIQQKLAEEPWKNLKINSIKSDQCVQLQTKLLCSASNSDSSIYFNINTKEYLAMLLPASSDSEFQKPEMPRNVISMSQLKTMPITDQVRSLLINSKLIKMSQLLALLPPDVENQIVIRALQQVATLVQGCWVVKSEVLYPKDSVSSHSGVPSDILCRARDYVMWCFTQNRFIIRKDVHSVVKLPQEDMKEILQQISVLRVNKGWEFVVPYDVDFTKKYPEVVQRQQMLWDAKYNTLCKAFSLVDSSFKGKVPNTKPVRRRRRTKSGHSTSGDDSSGTDLSKKSMKPLQIKPEPLSPIKNFPNDQCNGARNIESRPSDPDSSTVRFIPSSQMKTELSTFVQGTLEKYNIISIPRLRRLLNNKLTVSPPGHILSTGVSDAMLLQCLHDFGGEKFNFKWLPDNEDVYVFLKLDDPHEKIRRAILEMFHSSEKFRFIIAKKKIEDSTGQVIDENDLKNILKDYATFKSGVIHFNYP